MSHVSEHPTFHRLTPIEYGSVASLVYEQIRGLILGDELPPGSRLSQADLAEQLGVSRTPVREVLRRLAGEGLVEHHPQHGFRAVDLGLDAVMRRLEVRLLLEPGIARLAVQRADAADIGELRRAIRTETSARSSRAAHDASRLFHVTMAKATHNEEL
ncbi:MAG: GntR family transcriptional regulator, partial [Solirubrobacteraceae bacterium]